jgi:dCMP deaminase
MHKQQNANEMQGCDHNAFMTMANNLALKSNCVRRSVGAVIVRRGRVVAEGWNGVSESHTDCRAAGCPRCISGGDTGSGYETCICIHAEQHAIADAARQGIATEDSALYVNLRPCLQCLVIAKASGVREIFYSGEEWTYSDEIEQIYRAICDQFDSFTRVDYQEGSQLGRGRVMVP